MAKKEADKNAEDDDDDDEIVEPKHFQTIERAKLRRRRIRTVVNFEEAGSKTAFKEPIVRVSVDQNRNDILHYLDRLISNVEWLVISHYSSIYRGQLSISFESLRIFTYFAQSTYFYISRFPTNA